MTSLWVSFFLLPSFFLQAETNQRNLAADASKTGKDGIEFFDKEVFPFLQRNCFKCHGNDPHKLRGHLWLKSREGILKGGDVGPAVDLKDPANSYILKMINYTDDEHQMPPKGKLPQEKIDILTKWVLMGIPWSPGTGEARPESEKVATTEINEHTRNYWAYRKPVRPSPSKVKDTQWITNPIDGFILSPIEMAGLAPAPMADKITLIRRATYDLIGLPPTPEEVDIFLADTSPDAYEKLLDSLLNRPQYGEKWGRHWLDLVRYAETNGYERDSTKPFAWRYRDYVIDSFNNDKPFDRFIKEQLAGDELDEVTAETIIATGYYRLGIWDDEPVDRKLQKYDVLDGVVTTTAQVMLGMSIGCARCHNHKKDPILQKDYYRFLAFFHDVTDMNKKNTIVVKDAVAKKKQEAILKAKKAKEEKLYEQIRRFQKDFRLALEDNLELVDVKLSDLSDDDDEEESKPLVADARHKGKPGPMWSYTSKNPGRDWMKPGFNDKSWKKGQAGFGSRGTPGSIVRTNWHTRDIWLRRAFIVTKLPGSLALDIHHDEDAEVYINGKLVSRHRAYISAYKRFNLKTEAVSALTLGKNLISVHCRQTGGVQYIDVGLSDSPARVDIAELVKKHGPELMGASKTKNYFSWKSELDKSLKAKVKSDGLTVMAVKETGRRTSPHVLHRGNPHLEGEKVEPGFPSVLGYPDPVLPDKPGPTSGKRRVLAEWIASKENKLTARVMMNRIWQHHFGRGIVSTSSDFGLFGVQPTHPELLEWMTMEFMDNEWSLKKMHKLLMMSSAYRMSSKDNPVALQKDPRNQLFWRFNMRRLTAEEIRDSILAIGGSLNTKMGGPSIYTDIPMEVKHTASRPGAAWGRSSKNEAARRSVYIFVKRSLHEPFLRTFDLADTDQSCAARFTTTVPTQALTMLNSKFLNDQAAIFAGRLKKEAGDRPEDQVKLALRLALQRPPKENEVKRSVEMIQEFQKTDAKTSEESLKYFCLMTLNLNEFVFLD